MQISDGSDTESWSSGWYLTTSDEDTNSSKQKNEDDFAASGILSITSVARLTDVIVTCDDHLIKMPSPLISIDSEYCRSVITTGKDYLRYLEEDTHLDYFRKIIQSDWGMTPSNGFCGPLLAYGTDLVRFPQGYPPLSQLDISVPNIRVDFLNFLEESLDLIQSGIDAFGEYPFNQVDVMTELARKISGLMRYIRGRSCENHISSESGLWLLQEEEHALISLRRRVCYFTDQESLPGYARYLQNWHGETRLQW